MTQKALDLRQLYALLSVSLKLHARGKGGKTMYGRILSIIFSYGIASAYLAWSLSRSFHEPSYIAISVLVTSYLACYTVLSSYSIIFLDADERRILRLFPISQRTLLYSRIVNLLLFSALLSAPFVLPQAIFYGVSTGSTVDAALFAVVLMLSFLWVVGYTIILYNSLILRFASSSRLLATMQAGLVFLLLFFYQGLPSFSTAHFWWESFLTSAYAPLSPPHWFISVFGIAAGKPLLPNGGLLAMQAAATALFLLVLLRTRWILLPEMALTPDSPAHDASTAGRWSALYARLRAFKVDVRAGFELFGQLLTRDKTLRFQVVPIVMMPVAVALYGLMTGGLDSPFDGRIHTPAAKVHIPVMVFFLFSSRHIDQTVLKSVQPGAVWLLFSQSSQALVNFARGVRSSIFARILLPQAGLLLVLFSATMPVREAVLQTAFLVVVCRFQSASIAFLRPRIPFTENESHLATVHRFTQFFVILPYVMLALIPHALLSNDTISFIGLLLFLEMLTAICHVLSRKRRISLPGIA